MSDYLIYTDTACDIPPETLEAWGVRYVSMFFSFAGEERQYRNNDMEITRFYQKMREGGVAKSAAAGPDDYRVAFEQAMSEEKDILYLGLSAALSTSFQSARLASEELKKEYPQREIVLVDTLSASAGEGMLVDMAVRKKSEGATLRENAAYIEGIKEHVCHWFVVDDLDYLKRGGRVSPTVAFAGKLLGIKPILHVTKEGVPINVSKVRGIRAAIKLFADKFEHRKMQGGLVYISHADNQQAVELLQAELKSRFNQEVDRITYIGTVLGAHTGPGAMAFYFLDEDR